jgi:hypothetical protein
MTEKQTMQSACFNAYRHAVDRCTNKDDREYPRYGGRGIRVVWYDYEEFKKDMWNSYLGHRASNPGVRNTQLDRIDNDDHYYKENCRWVTAKENARNRKSNVVVNFYGKEYCLKEFAEMIDAPYKRVWKQFRKQGMSLFDIIKANA